MQRPSFLKKKRSIAGNDANKEKKNRPAARWIDPVIEGMNALLIDL